MFHRIDKNTLKYFEPIIFIFLYNLSWHFSGLFEVQPHVSVFYSPPSMAVVYGALRGYKSLIWIFIAAFASAYPTRELFDVNEFDISQILRQALIYGGCGIAISNLILPKYRTSYFRLPLVLLSVATLASTLSALWAAITFLRFNLVVQADLYSLFFSYLFGDLAGIIVFSPLLIFACSHFNLIEINTRNDIYFRPQKLPKLFLIISFFGSFLLFYANDIYAPNIDLHYALIIVFLPIALLAHTFSSVSLFYSALLGAIASTLMVGTSTSAIELQMLITIFGASVFCIATFIEQYNFSHKEQIKELKRVNDANMALNEHLLQKQFVIDQHAIYSETDVKGVITYVNDKFCEISGYNREELVGKTHAILNSNEHPKDFFSNLWSTIKNGETWHGDIKNKQKNGSYYWVKTSISPLYDEHGAIIGFASIRTEITENIERERKLRLASSEALEANAAKSNFIAAMSHELRTPLNAIIGFSQMMKDSVFGEIHNEKYSEYIDDINSSGVSLLSMVDDILDISRLESQNYQFELKEYDVGKFTEEFVRRFDYAIKDKHIELNVEIGASVPMQMYSDKRALTHVLNNLISNAIKAVDNEGKISVVWDLNHHGDLTLTVADDGCGMPQELINKIGQPFMHNEDAYIAKSPNVGAGLGLYICQNLLKARGAKMHVKSAIGKGSKFTITAPLSLFQKPMEG